MTRRNLSRKGLAHKLGLSRSYLSRVISGKKDSSPALRQRLMDFLKDYTFDELFTIEVDGNGDASNDE